MSVMNTMTTDELLAELKKRLPHAVKSTLSDYVEDISDDFGSTFSVAGENTLVNVLSESDFERVETIFRKYFPGTWGIEFHPTMQMAGDRDVYLIQKIERVLS